MNKLLKLRKILRKMDSALIAFSGGTDSTFLLKIAHEEIGHKLLAVTVISPVHTFRETSDAINLAKLIGVQHVLVKGREMNIVEFTANSWDRCYICKKSRFSKLIELGKKKGIKNICDGTNTDDFSDFRPGMKACMELHVRHPLAEAGLSKREIRVYSKKLGLPNWNKSSNACLATRIQHGQKLETKLLRMVENAETELEKIIKGQYRVRVHNRSARLELEKKYFKTLIANSKKISEKLKKLGFLHVSLDLDGYRTGSMNFRCISDKKA